MDTKEIKLILNDLIEQWDLRAKNADKLTVFYEEAEDLTSSHRCKIKAETIRSMMAELKREITTDDCESVVVISRYGDERIFKILDEDTIEYSFKGTDYVRYSSNRDDDTLTLVDCAGGPCVSVGMDLGSIHTDLEGIVVKEINVNGGSHYLTVRHEK